jgi:NAD(P)-dependent dehydrogenase (short-subunit alcohol dehydrogenase family)
MRVFIAGVNQGLGLVLSQYLAENGHTVFAGYRNAPSTAVLAAAKKYGCYKPIALDITDEAQAEAAAQKIRADGGALDAVALVAGVLLDSDRSLELTNADIGDLRAALDINVTGSAIVIKHFNGLVRDGGIFLVITSEGGSMTNIGTRYPAYSISKAAQNKLAAIFAKTVTRYKVYAVHPGRMNTVMGRNDAQIEPEVSAAGIYKILTGEKKVATENGWFINYMGEAMEI